MTAEIVWTTKRIERRCNESNRKPLIASIEGELFDFNQSWGGSSVFVISPFSPLTTSRQSKTILP